MPSELNPPTSIGANESIVVKKVNRLASIHVQRGATICFATEDAHVDSVTDQDRVVNRGHEVIRPLTAAILATKVGGTGATLGQTLAKLGDFYAQFRAEDVVANP